MMRRKVDNFENQLNELNSLEGVKYCLLSGTVKIIVYSLTDVTVYILFTTLIKPDSCCTF